MVRTLPMRRYRCADTGWSLHNNQSSLELKSWLHSKELNHIRSLPFLFLSNTFSTDARSSWIRLLASDYPDQDIDELDSELDELEDDEIPGLRKDLLLASRAIDTAFIDQGTTIHDMLNELNQDTPMPKNILLIDARLDSEFWKFYCLIA